MAYNSNGTYLKSVTVPQYSTDVLSRGPPLRDDIVISPSNENRIQSHGGFLTHNSHPSKSSYANVAHLPKLGHQQFQGILAPPPAALNGLGVSGADVPRSNPSLPSVDYQLLLLSLAEEYFTAAHGGELLDAIHSGEMESQAYYKLIATGLGCLEALLKSSKLQPHLEARVRLRYATVLHDETENSMQAEEALSKGIMICDRHKMFDLKYNMQHLLARILFKANPRASLKFIDGVIEDVEAYRHVAWIYAFRFLRVSLSLELSTHQDTVSALGQLKLISVLSTQYEERSIFATAAILEAMISLQQSNNPDNHEQAQRSLAAARSCQLDPTVGSLPHLGAFMHFVDLCSALRNFDPAQAASRVQAMQAIIEAPADNDIWAQDGSFAIPIRRPGLSVTSSTGGVVRNLPDGSIILMLKWIPRQDISTLCFLLSGVALSLRNTTDGQKAERFFREGLRHVDKNERSSSGYESISTFTSRRRWRQQLKCYLSLHLTFTLCARTAWPEAEDQFRRLKETAVDLQPHITENLSLLVFYLEGVIHQGTGNLSKALEIFQSPSLALANNLASSPPLHHDLSILSTLNTLLIIRSPSHPSHHQVPTLLSSLDALRLSPSTANKSLLAAIQLILATASQDSTIVRTKQHLQSALQTAKQASNNQLMCMTLNFMSWKFFRGVVGDQAEKSARASQNLARKGMDRLWASVAAGVLGDTLEVMGRVAEAEEVRREGREIAKSLPESMWRETLYGSGNANANANAMEGNGKGKEKGE